MPRTPTPVDPRLAPIQTTFRLPWYYRKQLDREADRQGITVPQLIVDAVEAAYPPATLPPMPQLPEAEG